MPDCVASPASERPLPFPCGVASCIVVIVIQLDSAPIHSDCFTLVTAFLFFLLTARRQHCYAVVNESLNRFFPPSIFNFDGLRVKIWRKLLQATWHRHMYSRRDKSFIHIHIHNDLGIYGTRPLSFSCKRDISQQNY
jgi:hypothetical protein